MDYEKKYKEALERARKIHDEILNNELLGFPEQIREIFPELRESEDERILASIADCIGLMGEDGDVFSNHNVTKVQVLSWLKKQKEQKPEGKPINWTELTWKDIVELEGIINNVHYDFSAGIGQESFGKEVLERFRNKKEDAEADACEQKPAWSEEDVKRLYSIGTEIGFLKGKYSEWQKDIDWLAALAEKMGFYKYKIGEVVTEWKKEDTDDKMLSKPKQEWSEEDNIGWDEAFACVTRAEKAAKNEEELQNAVTAEKWLKEIKFKYCVHPVKQEWSDEDEKRIQRIYDFLWKNRKGDTDTIYQIEKDADWLKSLRPQSKDEIYKEKDKAYKLGKHHLAVKFMNYLDENRPEGKMSLSNGECEDIDKAFKENDWAKIMRYVEKYRPSWKPSEEQMEALNRAVNKLAKTDVADSVRLSIMYDNLKKL